MAPEQEKAVLERGFIEKLIYGHRDEPVEGEPRRYRFTQDSPVLPDVWIRYGKCPTAPLDLLLTPRFGLTAGEVARQLREDCENNRTSSGRGKPFDIAYNQTYVVAELHFDELIRVVLPMTRWWQQNVSQAARTLMVDPRESPADSEESFRLGGLKTQELQSALIKSFEAFDQRGAATPEDAVRARELGDLLWMMRIVGSIAWAQKAGPENVPAEGPDDSQVVEAVAELVGDLEFHSEEDEKLVWQVNLNRPAGTAVERSTLAVKADAARLLFKVDCSEVAWAVVDSGIDASHPAFWRWRGGLKETTRAVKATLPRKDRRAWTRDKVKERLDSLREDPRPDSLWPAFTRVKATYDFTRARSLFSAGGLVENGELVGEALWPPFVSRTIRHARRTDEQGRTKKREQELRSKLAELSGRLAAGRGIDWNLAAPFLQVPHDDAEDPAAGDAPSRTDPRFYERPRSEHGTHVAGILGADWPHQMEGMCPDLGLYDMRVIGPDRANSDEFAVLSALQFISFLNDQKDLFAVHGVNMSLSIRHDVANFACGRTPACDECERLVASGVVVVAAAGNHGYLKYKTSEGVTEGYHTVSITDPGNAQRVITVGATHRSQPHTYGVSYFSSRGPTGDGRIKPDLVAPGEKIEAPVPNNGSRSKDGTSMAAPHVSGAAAMLLARHTELIGQPERIKRALTETATDLQRERYFQGRGMLDVLRALQSV